MVNLGYSKNDMLMLYKLRKNTEIILDNPEGKTEATNINKVVKQGSKFGSVIICASTSKKNNIKEKAQYNY